MIDNSVVLSWCLDDEEHPLADHAMRLTVDRGAVVPQLWWYEVRNALAVNERRGRLTAQQSRATLADLSAMRFLLDFDHDGGVVMELARHHGLSVYDAAYLEVALRRSVPLATLDTRLRAAATAAEVPLLGPDVPT